jgi:chromosome segregation ATPase
MKDKIAQLQKTFNEGLELLKAQKVDEAIAKMAEVAPIFKDIEAEGEQVVEKIAKSEDEIKKTSDLLKTAQESIQKWAEVFVTAENFAQLLEDVKATQAMVKTVEDLQKTVTELETVAKSRQVPGASVDTDGPASLFQKPQV